MALSSLGAPAFDLLYAAYARKSLIMKLVVIRGASRVLLNLYLQYT